MQKKLDILKFIRVAMLRQDQLNAALPSLVQATMSVEAKNIDVQSVVQTAKERILSDEHLEQFIPIVESIFSCEEIKRLICFYEDSAVDKYFKNGALLAPSIYTSFQQVIKSVLQEGEQI